MKIRLTLIHGLIFCLIIAQSAFADIDSDASAHVYVRVNPNLAVGVIDTNVDLGSVQMGDFSATITFRVEANVNDIWIWTAVSDLYKGDDPYNLTVDPLPVLQSEGVLIEPAHARPAAGASNIAAYNGPGDINGFPGHMTESINFESSQISRFSQDVDLTIFWTQPNPEQPQGEYSGLVKMYCFIFEYSQH